MKEYCSSFKFLIVARFTVCGQNLCGVFLRFLKPACLGGMNVSTTGVMRDNMIRFKSLKEQFSKVIGQLRGVWPLFLVLEC